MTQFVIIFAIELKKIDLSITDRFYSIFVLISRLELHNMYYKMEFLFVCLAVSKFYVCKIFIELTIFCLTCGHNSSG